jgi:flagellar basal body P-ring formation protein FlgA
MLNIVKPRPECMMMTIFRHMLIAAAAFPSMASAQVFESHAAIDARVAAALVGTGLAAWPIDRRLKLAACPRPLVVDPPAGDLVAVRCDALSWRVHARIEGPPATVTYSTPVVIKRDDPVTVDFVAPGFSVAAQGIAESDARAGDRVRVRVEQKSAPVVGEAMGMGRVRVSALN